MLLHCPPSEHPGPLFPSRPLLSVFPPSGERATLCHRLVIVILGGARICSVRFLHLPASSFSPPSPVVASTSRIANPPYPSQNHLVQTLRSALSSAFHANDSLRSAFNDFLTESHPPQCGAEQLYRYVIHDGRRQRYSSPQDAFCQSLDGYDMGTGFSDPN